VRASFAASARNEAFRLPRPSASHGFVERKRKGPTFFATPGLGKLTGSSGRRHKRNSSTHSSPAGTHCRRAEKLALARSLDGRPEQNMILPLSRCASGTPLALCATRSFLFRRGIRSMVHRNAHFCCDGFVRPCGE
jgi:hypothetical protein